MQIILLIIEFCLLIWVIISDFRKRSIYIINLVFLFLVSLFHTTANLTSSVMLGVLAGGLAFTTGAIISHIKQEKSMGFGDVIIIAYSGFRFCLIQFSLIIILSSLLGLGYAVIINKADTKIPFAGFISIAIIIILSLEHFLQVDQSQLNSFFYGRYFF